MKQRVKQLMRECDDLASRHWEQAASSRGQAYTDWLKKIKIAADFIRSQKKSA